MTDQAQPHMGDEWDPNLGDSHGIGPTTRWAKWKTPGSCVTGQLTWIDLHEGSTTRAGDPCGLAKIREDDGTICRVDLDKANLRDVLGRLLLEAAAAGVTPGTGRLRVRITYDRLIRGSWKAFSVRWRDATGPPQP